MIPMKDKHPDVLAIDLLAGAPKGDDEEAEGEGDELGAKKPPGKDSPDAILDSLQAQIEKLRSMIPAL